METIELEKVWVACEFCQTANMFSNQHCSNCGGPLNIELRITVTREDEEQRLYAEQQQMKRELAQKREEYAQKVHAEVSEWCEVPFEIRVHDFGGSLLSHTVEFDDRYIPAYAPFEFKEPFKKKKGQSLHEAVNRVVTATIGAVLFVAVGISLGPTILSQMTDISITSDIPLGNMIELVGSYVGVFYYLGIVIGAIAMVHGTTKLR